MLPHPPSAGNTPTENRLPTEAASALADLLASEPAAWVREGFELVKQSTVRTVLRGEVGPQGARQAVHVKLYRPGRLSDRVRDAASGARGELEARNLRLLRSLGLPAVAPLLAGAEPRSLGSRSWLVTASVPGAVPVTWQGPAA